MRITNNILLTLSAMILMSCTNNYTLSTNLDKGNFTQYFAPGQVEIYPSEAEMSGHYQFIGAVEGDDCQLKQHHAAPSEINARTHARQNAFNMGANAVIFTGCALIDQSQSAIENKPSITESKQCLLSLVCYGKAYKLEQIKPIEPIELIENKG